MNTTISLFIEACGIENIVIRKGESCVGEIVPHSSPEAQSIISKLKRVLFLTKEITRIQELFTTEFSSKAPKNIFDEHCKKLFEYEEELDKYDRTLILNNCE